MNQSKLDKLKETTAKTAFGSTKAEVLKEGICISCREEALPKCYSEAGRREYQISGLCELCFDEICS